MMTFEDSGFTHNKENAISWYINSLPMLTEFQGLVVYFIAIKCLLVFATVYVYTNYNI